MGHAHQVDAPRIDDDQFRATATRLLTSLPTTQEPLMSNWAFDELVYTTALQPRSKKKAMLMTFIRVLTGNLDHNQAVKLIQSL
jgi:hypothetical protein